MIKPQTDDNKTISHLRTVCDELYRQVAHSLAMEQQLVNARDSLDRDVTRLLAIQTYVRRVIKAEHARDFARITTEAVIEAFDLECSAILMGTTESRTLQAVTTFGLQEHSRAELRVTMDWVRERGLLEPARARIESVPSGAGPWGLVGLAEVILCSFSDHDGEFGGLLMGGISAKKLIYYGSISAEVIPSFTVFAEQMQSLLHNLGSRRVIRRQLADLEIANRELQKKTRGLELIRTKLERANQDLERRITELGTLQAVGTAIASILDLDQLLDAILKTAVRDLGYDRAMILLVDESRRVLTNGRGVGGTDEMMRYVAGLEIPLEGSDGLAGVVLSEQPLLVDTVDSGGKRGSVLDRSIIETLRTRSFLAVPLKAGAKVIGVMAVDNWVSGVSLTRHDQNLLTTLASQVAGAIENTHLVERLARSERLSAIGEMATGIAHEIRNPLTSIGTLADILQEQTEGGDPLLFEGIKQESRRLQNIATRLLNYASPYTPERTPEDINLLLEEVASLLAADENYRKVSVERQYDRTIDNLLIDGDRIKQVFWNLILNGMQAMPHGGTLTIRSENRAGEVAIQVIDTGEGIDKDDLKQIFQPFFTKRRGGSGLGLPIAEKIVEAHGGSTDIESEPGRGTTITVLLPR
jgi:signal transduction histidine kinase